MHVLFRRLDMRNFLMRTSLLLIVLLHFFRLRGVEGVRVVDASIMPQVISVNTMSTTIAIAEKAADLIKQEYFLS